MSRTAAVRPVRASSPAPPPRQKPSRRLPPGTPRRRPERRIYLIAFLISLALHAALLFFGPGLTFFADPGAVSEAPQREPDGFRLVQLRPVADAPGEVVADPAEPRRIVALPPVPTTSLPATADPPPAPLPSVAERLSRREGDARIWRPVPDLAEEPLLPGQILLERVRAALADTLGEHAYDPNLDWTFTDSQGRRWGFSEGKIHLGGLTIPAGEFVLPPGRREEIRNRLREWEEIQRQGASEEARAVQQERARAIRERRDAERRQRDDGS